MTKSGLTADNDTAPTNAYVVEQDIGDGKRILGWYPNYSQALIAMRGSVRTPTLEQPFKAVGDPTVNIRRVFVNDGKFWLIVKKDESAGKPTYTAQIHGPEDSEFEMDTNELGMVFPNIETKQNSATSLFEIKRDRDKPVSKVEGLYADDDPDLFDEGKLNWYENNFNQFKGLRPISETSPFDMKFNQKWLETDDDEGTYGADGAKLNHLSDIKDANIRLEAVPGVKNGKAIFVDDPSSKESVRVFTGFDYYGDHLEQFANSLQEGEYDLKSLYEDGVAESVDPTTGEKDGRYAIVFMNPTLNIPHLNQMGSQASFSTVDYPGGDASGWFFIGDYGEDKTLPKGSELIQMIGRDGYNTIPLGFAWDAEALGSRLFDTLKPKISSQGNVNTHNTDYYADANAWGIIGAGGGGGEDGSGFFVPIGEELLNDERFYQPLKGNLESQARNLGLWANNTIKYSRTPVQEWAPKDKYPLVRLEEDELKPGYTYSKDKEKIIAIGNEMGKNNGLFLVNRNIKASSKDKQSVIPIAGIIRQNYRRKFDGKNYSNNGFSIVYSTKEAAKVAADVNRRVGINTRTIQVKPRVWMGSGADVYLSIAKASERQPMYVNIADEGILRRTYMRETYPSCVKNASKKSGISKNKLLRSFKRGVGAAKTNPQSIRNKFTGKKRPGGWPPSKRYSPKAWGCARANKLARLGKNAGYDQDILRGD